MPSCNDLLHNIQVACGDNPQAGFTGRGLVILKKNATITRNAAGDLLSLTGGSGAGPYRIDNGWANSFDGTQNALSVENGRPQWHNDVVFRIPRTNPIDARETAQALAHNSSIVILEREDGTYPVYGLDGKLIATAATQAENANQADRVMTLGSDESTPERLLVDDTEGSPIKTAREKFNELWEAAE